MTGDRSLRRVPHVHGASPAGGAPFSGFLALSDIERDEEVRSRSLNARAAALRAFHEKTAGYVWRRVKRKDGVVVSLLFPPDAAPRGQRAKTTGGAV